MSWLDSSAHEVARFHPAFAELAEGALDDLGQRAELEWAHHIRADSSDLIPDFVLRERATGRWLVAVEVKRTSAAVRSERFQAQAKAYAEANQASYRPTWAKYFALTNLEVSSLFALNGERPPPQCRVEDGQFVSGAFGSLPEGEHRAAIRQKLRQLVELVMTVRTPTFDVVWAGLVSDLMTRSAGIPTPETLLLEEPDTPNWTLVRSYFGEPSGADARRLFLLRCLMAEYARGHLLKHAHPDADGVAPLQPGRSAIARTLDGLRDIDFAGVLEAEAPAFYRNLADPEHREILDGYVRRITTDPVRLAELVRNRVDSDELIEAIVPAIYPLETQDDRGKVQTDPELAAVLSALAIDRQGLVVDPCCGDGALLLATYERLDRLGMAHRDALNSVIGTEVDPITGRIAALRLAMQRPELLEQGAEPRLRQADMFVDRADLAVADFVLMNPPFRRYEAQDARPVPREVLEHYAEAIRQVDGHAPVTLAGQPNLFHYYIELVGKAVPAGCTVAVILDNRWYHNLVGQPLREFLLAGFEIVGIFEYPMSELFASFAIATSILVLRKVEVVADDHDVVFARSRVDIRTVDLDELAGALHRKEAWSADWRVRTVPQADLNPAIGWKRHFASPMQFPPHDLGLSSLPTLFEWARRGSLEKEGYGTQVYEFPFDRTSFGPRRESAPGRKGFQTRSGRALTAAENARLVRLARSISVEFRGWALRNADDLGSFELTVEDVERRQTLEPPLLRASPNLFRTGRRSEWSGTHTRALRELQQDATAGAFLEAIEDVIGFDARVLPDDLRFVVLREPYAGELIIPRKMRAGHRVHINPFALDDGSRQVRISSNFITYGGCVAYGEESDVRREESGTVDWSVPRLGVRTAPVRDRGVQPRGLLVA